MNTKIAFGILLCSFGLTSMAQANDKVDQVYNPQKYQQVCKGKKLGDPVSFSYKGILWNGSCQPRFFPSKSTAVKGDEKELTSICASYPDSTEINIEGSEFKGKCALGFTAPQPH